MSDKPELPDDIKQRVAEVLAELEKSEDQGLTAGESKTFETATPLWYISYTT